MTGAYNVEARSELLGGLIDNGSLRTPNEKRAPKVLRRDEGRRRLTSSEFGGEGLAKQLPPLRVCERMRGEGKARKEHEEIS